MELLLQNNQLIFNAEQLIGDEVLNRQFRKPKVFTDKYLTMDFEQSTIVVLVIQDNSQPYYIKRPYADKIKSTHLIITAPEIEMLMAHSLKLYDDYQKYKSKMSPSKYLSEKLKEKASKIKSKNFILKFYSKHSLVDAIQIHAQKAPSVKKCKLLVDLLK